MTCPEEKLIAPVGDEYSIKSWTERRRTNAEDPVRLFVGFREASAFFVRNANLLLCRRGPRIANGQGLFS